MVFAPAAEGPLPVVRVRGHMCHSARIVSFGFCCILISHSSAAWAANGKINGWVRAAVSGLPLQASVEIVGTGIGTVADSSGRFVLLNVPPGSYTLRATAVGWKPTSLDAVVLHENQILNLVFTMTPQDIVLTETVIESPQPAIDPSKTSAWTRFETEEFTELPVHAAAAVLQLSPASFGESVRGGRAHQTVTVVDGIDITDKYVPRYGELGFGETMLFPVPTTSPRSGSASLLDIPLNSIDQGTLFAGTWGPEYGGVSGAVSYTLRQGGRRWSGSAHARISQLGGLKHLGPDVYNDQAIYFAEKAKRAAATSAYSRWESTLFTWSAGKYDYGNDPDVEGGFSIGGPLWDDAGLYITTGYYDTHGRLPGFRFRQFNGTLKFSATPWNGVRLNLTALLEDRGRLLGWKNRAYIDQYRYFLEGVPRTDGVTGVGGARFTYMITPQSYCEIQLSASSRNSRTGYCDDNDDGRISIDEGGDFLTWEDTAQVNRYQSIGSLVSQPDKFFSPSGGVLIDPRAATFVVAGPAIRYKELSTLTYTAQVLFSSTVGSHHTLTSGLRATFHDISLLSRQGGALYPAYRNYTEESWTRRPREFNVYISDQMDFAGLIVSACVRLDVFDLRSADYLNLFAPFELRTSPAGTPIVYQVRGPDVPPRAYVSPRLAVSHPVSDVMALHFSMSITQDQPPYSLLFTEYRKEGNWIARLVRVGQDPQHSTSYDLGLQWSPVDQVAIDINAYQKDYGNYFSTDWGTNPSVYVELAGSGSSRAWLPVFTTHGSVLSRGVEVSFNVRPTQLASFITAGGRASYSYSYAVGGLETGPNRTQFSAVLGDSALYGGTLPFDQFDGWNKKYVHIPGGLSTTVRGYDRRHRFTCSGIFSLPADLTLSVAGRFASGFYYPLPGPEPYITEWGEGPWNKQIDLRLRKEFPLEGGTRISLYVDLINAFNWVNIVALVGDPNVLGTSTQAWTNNQDPTGGRSGTDRSRTSKARCSTMFLEKHISGCNSISETMMRPCHAAILIALLPWVLHAQRKIIVTPFETPFTLTSPGIVTRLEKFDALPHEGQIMIDGFAWDQKGFLWVRTNQGLARFDGYELKVYRESSTDKLGAARTQLAAMAVDGDGFIWGATSEVGLKKLDPATGKSLWYSGRRDDSTSVGTGATRLLVTSDGQLWAGVRFGLARYNKESGSFVVHNLPLDRRNLGDFPISSLCEIGRSIWLAVPGGEAGVRRGGGVLEFRRDEGVWKRYTHDSATGSGPSHNIVRSVCSDRTGRLWVGTWSGLDRYDPRSGLMGSFCGLAG